MVVGVPKESFPGERRVALVPAVTSTLRKAGLEVVVEAGAGIEAGYPDADYVAKGATILPGRADVFRTAVVITQVLGVGSNDRTGDADLPFFRPDQLTYTRTSSTSRC
jgi:NAD(P) transhydrogenase subunit alpha